MNKVAIVRCPDYDPDRAEAAVREALGRLGGIGRFIRSGQRVLVKPNLLSAVPPELAVTTHPAVLRAVLKLVLEAGGRAFVGDSPMGDAPARALAVSGIEAVCREYGVEQADFTSAAGFSYPEGRLVRSFELSPEAGRADAIINLPKVKTHGLTGLTCAVKNLFGLIPGKRKMAVHLRHPDIFGFSRFLVDLYGCVRPALHIADGITAMQGPGPRNGAPYPLGLILASASGVSLDCAVSYILGYVPREIPTTRLGAARGFGVADPQRLEILGPSLAELRAAGFDRRRPGSAGYGLMSFTAKLFAATPVFSPTACRLCRRCLDLCPAGALAVRDQAVTLDGKSCLRCYCCHEACPHDAVELRRPLLGRWLDK